MAKPQDDSKCSSCGGDSYHYAGCAKGEHGEIYLPCNRWIERAVESLMAARKSDSFHRLLKWKQDAITKAIVDLGVLK